MNIFSLIYLKISRTKFFYWEIIKKNSFSFKLKHCRILFRKLRAVILGRGLKLRILFISPTYRCQCRCPHCLAGFYKRAPQLELSDSEIKRFIDQLKEVNPLAVSFFGGEPLLRKNIGELINYTSSKGYITELETNGLLLDRNRVRGLKKAGLNRVYVSLDSGKPDVHDRLRGIPGCYEKALNALRYCVAEGLFCGINTYATKEKIRDGTLKEIIEIGRRIGVNNIFILFPSCAGRWLFNEQAALDKEDISEIKKLFKDNVANWMRGTMPISGRLYFKCSVLEKITCYISPYGEVQPCCCLPFSFGNIRESGLRGILRRLQQHPMFREAEIIKDNDCMMNNHSWRQKYIYGLDVNRTTFPYDISDQIFSSTEDRILKNSTIKQ